MSGIVEEVCEGKNPLGSKHERLGRTYTLSSKGNKKGMLRGPGRPSVEDMRCPIQQLPLWHKKGILSGKT